MSGSELTHFSLFSGVGGIDLAAEWAGFETVGQCEFADYQTKVLEKRFPNIARWRDVRDVGVDSFRERTGLRTVDLISGGFPCQDLSVAGKQKGLTDADGNITRSGLWFEMLRVIHELRPRWVLAENVRGAVNLALPTVKSGLEEEGYKVWPFVIPASAFGAPHRRERLFVVGCREDVADLLRSRLQGSKEIRNTNGCGEKRNQFPAGCGGSRRLQEGQLNPDWVEILMGYPISYTDLDVDEPQEWPGWPAPMGMGNGNWPTPTVADIYTGNLKSSQQKPGSMHSVNLSQAATWDALTIAGQYPYEPPRVIKGGKRRADRLKCLGNSVVPQQAYPLLRAIAEMEVASETRPHAGD